MLGRRDFIASAPTTTEQQREHEVNASKSGPSRLLCFHWVRRVPALSKQLGRDDFGLAGLVRAGRLEDVVLGATPRARRLCWAVRERDAQVRWAHDLPRWLGGHSDRGRGGVYVYYVYVYVYVHYFCK